MPKFHPASRHREYRKWYETWFHQRCLLDGDKRIKQDDVCEKFLPRLEGQDQSWTQTPDKNSFVSSYAAYKERATFTNYTSRTRDGLVGAIMRKAPKISWDGDPEYLDRIGLELESLEELINGTLEEAIGISRFGHLVDLDGESNNPEPYVASYYGEAITDWEWGVVNGRKQLIRVHLREEYTGDSQSVVDKKAPDVYRVLRLGVPQPVTEEEEKMGTRAFLASIGLNRQDVQDGPVYYQEMWTETTGGTSKDRAFARTAVIVPKALGLGVWREIPFVIYNATKTGARTQKPLLDDIAIVNKGHYRNAADLEHGLHFSGLPQPWVAGFQFKHNLFIGSGAAWVSEDPHAQAGYLEVQSDFAALTNEMTRKEKRMAVLGARLLEEQTNAGDQEAPGTVKMRQAGERSILARMSIMVSQGISKVLRFVRRFQGRVVTTKEVFVRLNLDFGVEELSPQAMLALMQNVQNGLMSWDTYVYNLQRGEMYPDDWDTEREAASIKAGVPGRSLDELLDPQTLPSGGAGVDKATKPKKKVVKGGAKKPAKKPAKAAA